MISKAKSASAYELLQISPEASEGEVTKQYRKLSIMIHPDKCQLEGASEAFQILAKAYADTKLHTAWKDTPAPQAAIDYWKLPAEAMWVDCLKRMLADESHHRDVNHAMASMSADQMFGEANPFIHEHKADYEAGVKRYTEAVLKKALGDVRASHTTRSTDVLA